MSTQKCSMLSMTLSLREEDGRRRLVLALEEKAARVEKIGDAADGPDVDRRRDVSSLQRLGRRGTARVLLGRDRGSCHTSCCAASSGRCRAL